MRRISLRVADALILLWLVTTLTFALVHLAPGDPSTLLIPPSASAEDAARLRSALGLDASIPEQYVQWLGRLLKGDMGESIVRAQPVTSVIAAALPVSLFLGGVSLALSLLIGTAVGAWQALRARPAADRAATIVSTVIYATPSFWLALALVTLFTTGAVWLGFPSWLRLPAFGMENPAADPGAPPLTLLSDRLRHAVLPLVVLAVPGAAGVARYARASVYQVRSMAHVRAALARGLPRARVERRYVMRTALTPIVVLVGLMLPGVVAGSVFVEQVFAWPGLGRTMLSAIATRDYPVVLGVTLMYAGTVILANLLADFVLWWLDPRRRQ